MFSIAVALTPFWALWLLFHIWFAKWKSAVRKSFILYSGRTSLRIRFPQEVSKSPEAMEFVLAQIHNVQTPDNLMQTYLQGRQPLDYSLELVSIGGDVRFYANVPTKKIKSSFEANLYAQYPGVEIEEEPVDYTAEIPVGTHEWDMMSFHLGKKSDSETAD